MADHLSPEKRSWNMRRIKSAGTKPEMFVKRLLAMHGFRLKLNEKSLPGSPDVALPDFKTAVFVNGCFWHRHKGCKYASTPKSHLDFWKEKFRGNVERDKAVHRKLREKGWKVIIIWECTARFPERLQSYLIRRLIRWK